MNAGKCPGYESAYQSIGLDPLHPALGTRHLTVVPEVVDSESTQKAKMDARGWLKFTGTTVERSRCGLP
jgi:hypothetical protein